MLNVLMFYSTYLAGFVLAIWRMPVFAFVLYEAVYFYNPQQRWWAPMVPDLSYSLYVSLLVLTLVIIKYKTFKENKLLSVPHFRWMYFVLILYAIAYFYANNPETHARYLDYYFKTILIVSLAYKLIDTSKKLDYALFGYIFGAWYIGFVAYQTGRTSGDRLEGIGTVDSPDANGIAAAIAPALVLSLYYFWISNEWWKKALFIVAGVFIANGLVLINSRGAFLAAAVSLAYFMYHMYTSSFQRPKQKLMAVFITVFGLMGAATLADDSFIERMRTITDTEVNEDRETAATRTVFWGAAWEMAKDHPFGAGYLGFNRFGYLYMPANVNTGKRLQRTVHSTWFETLTEIGYLGLFAFVAMLFSAYRVAKKSRILLKERGDIDDYFKVLAIEAACISFIVSMTFLNRLRAEILYWCLLYIACAYNIYYLKFQTAPITAAAQRLLQRNKLVKT
ncbi:O-antigen ligase family protein [Paraglaciecola sp. 25GB23A]|uniref:O-antigen ligase family protein n=1 Tax=Paraglaciecola sp. 25GB23A TaxID=3156068 RepID=UPI0032AE8F1D